MFPLLFINCPGKFSPSNWAWPQKETIPDILSVKSDAYLRGKIISANLIRKTNGNWYLLCIFALVNFPVGEVLGGDLHFVASVKALITLKTKHSLRSEESPVSSEAQGVSCDLPKFAKLQKKIKDWNFCFDQCYVMKTCCTKQILTSGKIFYANLVKKWQL